MPTVELMMTHQRPKTSVVILMLVVLRCCSVNAQPLQVVYFDQYLEKKNSSSAWAFEKFCPVSTSLIARRVLESYGSMFVAHESVNLPPTCVQKAKVRSTLSKIRSRGRRLISMGFGSSCNLPPRRRFSDRSTKPRLPV
jgi:hypothetical protein